jgi:hypothetical protein
MKRLVMLCAVTVLMSASAMRAQPPGTCNNRTLVGAYGITFSGTWAAPSALPNTSALPGDIENVIGVVIQTFDGLGNFSQTNNIKGANSGIIPNYPASGTYSINSDCTGTYTLTDDQFPLQIVTQIVIVKSGTEFRGVVVSPQAMMVRVDGSKI